MEASMMTLLLSDYHDDHHDEDDFFDNDFGGLVAPKSDCPHIASHVKFRVIDGEMMLLLSPSSPMRDDDTNDRESGESGRTARSREFHWLQFNASSTVTSSQASCQHFECTNRRTNNRQKENQSDVDEIMMMGERREDDTNKKSDDEIIIGNEVEDKENEGGEEEEDENVMGIVGENWLCLECGSLHCSRYQFGHAKLHYETTKEQQQQQQQQMSPTESHDIMEAPEEGGRENGVEGHCIAVSMADLSVWCYECNSYLRHPTLHELTAHLEGLKFGRNNDDDDDHAADGKNFDKGREEDEEKYQGGEEDDDDDQGELVNQEAKTNYDVLEDPMLNHDNEESLNTTAVLPSNEEPQQDHALRNYNIHRKSTLSSSASSSSNNSITSKRKGKPAKRRAPETTHNHDWSYQKFKPDDGHGKQTSHNRSNTTAEFNNDDYSSLEGGEEDEEIAALIESQHGDMLRAYLARHESFDTSNMGQCVPMHMPRPPSFPDEMADFLRSPLCKSIIVLAGAGMSVSCGIPDFRSVGVGLYDTLRPELLTASAEERELIASDPAFALHKHLFLQNPLPMLETKRSFILGTHEKKWKATLAHRFVELLHTKLGKLTRVYTQNIDGLELQTAIPTKKVVNVHGSMGAAACELCGHKMDFDEFCDKVRSNIKDITGEDVDAPTKSTPIYCEACGEATVKPDIVLFAGSLPKIFYKHTAKDLPEADLLIVMGTSLSVAPANSLVYRVPSTALRLIMNNERVGRSLGIDYSDSAIRDVWAHGSTDKSCLDLAEKMGWLDDLESFMDDLPHKSARMLQRRLAARGEKDEK